jgi:uncharacterized protein YbaA (DUF1428 family)
VRLPEGSVQSRVTRSAARMMEPKAMPFDVKRMAYGGFRILVDA